MSSGHRLLPYIPALKVPNMDSFLSWTQKPPAMASTTENLCLHNSQLTVNRWVTSQHCVDAVLSVS